MLATLVIVIAKHGDDRYAKADERVEQRLHFLGATVIRKVSGDDEQIGVIAHTVHLLADAVIVLGGEMKVGGSSYSHRTSQLGGRFGRILVRLRFRVAKPAVRLD